MPIERAISLEEVREAVNEMKSGKASWISMECLKKGGMAGSTVKGTVGQ